MSGNDDQFDFQVGDYVRKGTGDYTFYGHVRAGFLKRSGQVRYVVENGDGILHIFSGNQLEKMEKLEL